MVDSEMLNLESIAVQQYEEWRRYRKFGADFLDVSLRDPYSMWGTSTIVLASGSLKTRVTNLSWCCYGVPSKKEKKKL